MYVVFKELKAPRTGVSTEGGEATAANWKWFVVMDEVMGQRPSITPPNLISSAMATTPAAVVSPPEQGVSSKRKREPEWVSLLREFQEREDEKEHRLEEREDKKEREALEREEKRERERREEERRHSERRDREFREWMDSRAREERREREVRERENQAREERVMMMFQAFMEKK